MRWTQELEQLRPTQNQFTGLAYRGGWAPVYKANTIDQGSIWWMLGCGHLSVGSSVSHEFEADGAKLFTPQDIMAIAVKLLVLFS